MIGHPLLTAILTPLQQLSCYTTNPTSMVSNCVFPQLVAATGGEGMFGFLVGSTLIAGLWLAGDGGLATPATVTVLLGGLLFPTLPPKYLGIARVVTFLGLAAALLAGIEKYYLEGAQ